MAENDQNVERKVKVGIEVPLNLTPLNKYIELFKAMNVEVEKLHKNLGSIQGSQFSKFQVEGMLKQQFNKGKRGPGAVADLFGFTEADVRNYAAGIKRALNTMGDFSSLPRATQVALGMLKSRNEVAGAVLGNLRNGSGTIAPEALGKNAAQSIAAEIGKMTQAVVNALGGRNAQGQFTPGGEPAAGTGPGTGALRRGRRRGGSVMEAPGIQGFPNETGRTVVRTPDFVRTTIRQQIEGMDKVVATTFDELKNELRTVTTTTNGRGALTNVRNAEGMVKEVLRGQKAGLKKGDLLGLANLQEAAAQELEKLLTEDLKNAVGAERFGPISERLRAKAESLRSGARGNRESFVSGMMSGKTLDDVSAARQEAERAATLERAERRRKQQRAYESAEGAAAGGFTTGETMEEVRAAREREDARVANLRSRQRRILEEAKGKNAPPVIAPPEIPEEKMGMGGQFLKNTAKVTMWSASVGALYGSLDVMKDALKTVLETELQTQRLGQVFRGVGGDARALTVDVLGLAAAEGRSRDEAMESAISWSRLCLTRRQVNEAVRQSLVAANVAEIDAAEATEKLQAIMSAYGLQVSDLHGLLGQLNETSNTFNVTNKDLLEGLTKTASVAKQAGVPLQELIGTLAAGVGTTGQTGSNIGNALKSIMVSLSDTNIQKFLRNQYHLEVTQEGGREMKPLNQVFSELFVKYQGMNSGQRQGFLQQVAGKTQASRLAAVMDSYVKGQVLGIEAQRNLNSAEEENARIKDSLISKIRTLRSEWDKLLVSQAGQSGATGMVGQGVSGLTGVLQLAGRLQNIPSALPFLSGPMSGKSAFDILNGIAKEYMPTPEEYDQQMTEGYHRSQQASRGLAGSAGQASNLYDTLKQALRVSSDPGKLLRDMGGMGFASGGFAERLGAAVGGKDWAAVDRLLEKEKQAAQETKQAALVKQAASIEEEKGYLRRRAEKAGPDKRGDYEAQLAALENRQQGVIKEFVDDDAFEKFEQATLQGLIHVEKTKLALQQVADIYRSIPTATVTQRNALEAVGLGEQEGLLRARIAGLKGQNLAPQEYVKINKELNDQLDRVQAEREALLSPEAQAGARRADRANVASSMAGNAAERFSFGEMRVDQLQNRIAGVQRLVQAQEALAKNAQTQLDRENALVAAQTLRTDLVQSQLELERERARLVQTEFEYSRKLLTMGPQELMTHLFANRVLKQSGGLNAGQFFGFSGETRGALLEEEQSRRRREFLRRTPSARELQEQLGLVMNGNFGDRSGGLEGGAPYKEMADAASAAAVDLGVLRDSTAGAAAAMGELRGELQSFMRMISRPAEKPVRGGWDDRTGTGAPWLGQAYG